MSNEVIQNFLDSLRDAFQDITALEVNTMVVSEIRGTKFDPEDAYSLIYNLPGQKDLIQLEQWQKNVEERQKNMNEVGENLLEEDSNRLEEAAKELEEIEKPFKNLNPALYNRYIQLRQRLEKVCTSMNWKIKDEDAKFLGNYPAFKLISGDVDETKIDGKIVQFKCINLTRLPLPDIVYDPDDNESNRQRLIKITSEAQENIDQKKEDKLRSLILSSGEVLRRLRKLNELRALMSNPLASENNVYDLIYAQTIIQIDGDIINRFDKKMFKEEHQEIKDFLLKIHQEAVTLGEEDWRNLLNLALDLVKKIVNGFRDWGIR